MLGRAKREMETASNITGITCGIHLASLLGYIQGSFLFFFVTILIVLYQKNLVVTYLVGVNVFYFASLISQALGLIIVI